MYCFSVPIWRPRRKVIAPIFSVKNLNQFVEVFSEQGSVMVNQLKTMAGKGSFPLWKYLTTYTMDSVCGMLILIQPQINKLFKTKKDMLSGVTRHVVRLQRAIKRLYLFI